MFHLLCFSLSPSLSSISISLALLLSPSVCVLCPLRWSLVSLMVPKMHCGFVGAVRRKGMCECESVCVCVYVCACGQREVMRSFRHMRGFPSAALGRANRFKGTYTHARTHTHISVSQEKPLKLRKFTHYVH